MALSPGTRLGPYEILSPIGAGGMGEVYKARDSRLNRTVAIKVLRPDVGSPDRLHRFEQEVRAASALNHPNVLTIHDVGREGETVYFAMEWVEGRTLRELMTGPRLPMHRVIDLAYQVAKGLAKAHTSGIVHRDLKPENVMVNNDGFAKIVDFGLARLAESENPSAGDTVTRSWGTTPGLVMGTVGYMSPEQASGHPVDYRSDQFSLGLLIYELATRSHPFKRATTAQSLAATIETEPPPIEALNPEVPPHLAAVVARCLAKDPADRYESTGDLARDLKQIRHLQSPSALTPAVSPLRPHNGRLTLTAVVVALIGLSSAALFWRWNSVAPGDPARPLIVVRDFRNLSPDAAQRYFADGISIEIEGRLSYLAALRLLSRSAVEPYGEDLRRMASELGVGALLQGSAQVEKDRIQIAVALIDPLSNRPLWSQLYDRELSEIFAVQADVALQIARVLQLTISPEERQRLENRPTQKLEAYKLHLQALGQEGDIETIELWRKAIALDPSFALAKAHLAYALVQTSQLQDSPNYREEGVTLAQAALRRDPYLSLGHSTLGAAYMSTGRASQARLSFQRALTLDPNLGNAMANLSVLEVFFGRFAESLEWARRMFLLSGRSPNAYYHLSVPLLSLRDDDVTWRWLVEGERRFPESSRLQIMLATLEVLRGRDTDSVARLKRAAGRTPTNEELKHARSEVAFLTDSRELESLLEPLMQESAGVPGFWVAETPRLRYAYALARRGDSRRASVLIKEAEEWARAKIAEGDETPVWRIELAAVQALRGSHASAIEAIERAYDVGYREYGFLERDPILAPLRSSSGFRAVLDRMLRDVNLQRQTARERGLLEIDSLIAPPKIAIGPGDPR